MEEVALRHISAIKGLPIFDLETSGHLGVVGTWKVSPDQKLLAFCIKKGAWLTRPLFLATTDVVEYDDKMIVVRSSASLAPAGEIVELAKTKVSTEVVGSGAVTHSGIILGRVTDFAFEVVSSRIMQYTVEGPRGSLIIPASRVMNIKKNKVIFSDDTAVGARTVTAKGMSPA